MIDGIFGGQTTSGIRYFQDYQRNGGGQSLAVDGMVDVCNKDSPISTISRTLYTILSLNDWFQKYGEEREHNANLERHPDIIRYAPELRM